MIEQGVYFGNIHSFYDLNLLLSSVEITPANPKETYIDIPGAHGSLDLTEAHGEVKFYDRTIKLLFTMNPEDDLTDAAWEAKKTEVGNALNGLACHIRLDKDPDYYWQGRCKIDSYTSNKRIRQFAITATVRPFKFKLYETAATFALSEDEKTVALYSGRMPVSPVITCTDTATIVFDGNVYSLGTGTHKVLGIRFAQGNNQVIISGTGYVTFTYREGEL